MFPDAIESLETYLARHQPATLDAAKNAVFSDLTPSAVLVLVYPREGAAYLPFISRTRDSKVHGGEMAFPGGRFEAGVDASLRDTALREAQEEVGVDPAEVTILGQLDEIWTITGYRIRPFVACTTRLPSFHPQEEEVHAIYEIPLAHLLDAVHFQESVAKWTSTKYPMYYFHYADVTIFGATAYVLFDLLYHAFAFRPPLKRAIEQLYAIRNDPRVIQAAMELFALRRRRYQKRRAREERRRRAKKKKSEK